MRYDLRYEFAVLATGAGCDLPLYRQRSSNRGLMS
jgi:hypothetical protein